MAIKLTIEGESLTVDVPKGEEVYDAASGLLHERWTGTVDELEQAFTDAKAAEKERIKNRAAAAKAAAKAADAEAKRTAAAN